MTASAILFSFPHLSVSSFSFSLQSFLRPSNFLSPSSRFLRFQSFPLAILSGIFLHHGPSTYLYSTVISSWLFRHRIPSALFLSQLLLPLDSSPDFKCPAAQAIYNLLYNILFISSHYVCYSILPLQSGTIPFMLFAITYILYHHQRLITFSRSPSHLLLNCISCLSSLILNPVHPTCLYPACYYVRPRQSLTYSCQLVYYATPASVFMPIPH